MNNHNIEKEVKLNAIIDRLNRGAYKISFDRAEPERHKIDRQTLKGLISSVLNITDAHTINGWIDYLIHKGFLEYNPHSQITPNGHIKPSNDTRYYINHERLSSHTHIGSFCSSPENQKAIKDNSSKP